MSNAGSLCAALALIHHHPDMVVIHKGTSCGPSTPLYVGFEPYGLYLGGMIVVEDLGPIREAPALEAIFKERDHLLEYMAVPDVPAEPWYHEKPARRSGQKTRPHWPLDKRSGRR